MSSALMVMFLAVTGGKQVTAEAPEKSVSPTWPKETKTMAKEAVLSWDGYKANDQIYFSTCETHIREFR